MGIVVTPANVRLVRMSPFLVILLRFYVVA